MSKTCASCLMPFKNDPGQREHDEYCSLCFQHGKLCYAGSDLKEFQRYCYQGMRERGMNVLLARIYTFTLRFAPRWRKQK